MTAIDFYKITTQNLERLAEERKIKNLERYYELTDYAEGRLLSHFSNNSEKGKIFAQMAFHAQNATLISNIVKFEQKIEFLKTTLCNFEPEKLLAKYPADEQNRKNSILSIVEALRWSSSNLDGLKWDIEKSKPENKDAIMKRYANTLLDCAFFLEKYKGREDFKEDLEKHFKGDYCSLIKFFRSNVPNGFSIALSCDFLKEFDRKFDLPKPDIHIKDTLCIYKQLEENYYHTEKREYECIGQIIDIVKEINQYLVKNNEKQITVYQLDRMIWLICSQNFFLDGTENSKEKYLSELKSTTIKYST